MTLLVCRTCPRYDTRRSGRFATALTEAVAVQHPPTTLRRVQCLGGCPRDGVVALDGPGKARVRFADLTADDARAIVAAACNYERSPTGEPDDWDVPESLRARMSSVTLKRSPTERD